MCTVPGRHDEALAIAERGRTRAFADLLVERQKGSQHSSVTDPYIPVTVEHMVETVNSQRALVLYYSVAGGFLYSWLIAPGTGNCCVVSIGMLPQCQCQRTRSSRYLKDASKINASPLLASEQMRQYLIWVSIFKHLQFVSNATGVNLLVKQNDKKLRT